MTISSLNSSNALTTTDQTTSATQSRKPHGHPSGPPPNVGTPPSSEDMKAMIAKLKETDPTLAEKLEKVSTRMDELKKSRVSQQDAMKTIESEFGKPTDDEMQEIGNVLQQLQTGHQVNTTA